MELDSYLMFEPDVEEVYGYHCRYDSVVSNTDKTTLKTPLTCVDLDSTAGNETDVGEIADAEEIEYCCTETMTQLMPVLS